MCVLAEVAAEIRRQEMASPSYEAQANQRRLERYRGAAVREYAKDPLYYVERFLRGVECKNELRFRPIPRHRALVIYQEKAHEA